ncbi:MAG: TlpA family protein disulfide reductase [bacterium]|nr:TlpA family protein disulfide reductase [bacterium]
MKTLLALILSVILLNSASAGGRNWSLQQVNGGDFSIANNAGGRPSLLVFWATWCKPCKAELSNLKDTFDDLQRRGMNVLLVSEDNQKSMSRVKPFLDSKGFTWTGLHDPDGEVLKLYGGTSIPYTVMLDPSGSPVFEHRGEMKDTNAMITRANQLLESAGE